MEFIPIGIFHAQAKYPYDVPRQGILAGRNTGWIELNPGQNFETALQELENFSRIWVVFVFDRNGGVWHPKVQPPRHTDHKVGVFATRSPYRPNPIGLSCVELLRVQGRTLFVQGHDLLDGTPVLDIKPYLPYADAFPDAKAGWTQREQKTEYQVELAPLAGRQLHWLEEHDAGCLREFLREQLAEDPLNPRRHRLVGEPPMLAYRTWRIHFQMQDGVVRVTKISSGYRDDELSPGAEDPYQDKELHRQYLRNLWREEDDGVVRT